MPSDSSSRAGGLYFAYGSNLHLGQMHRRCPASRYIGTASLPSHRFHINQRGYANVLYSPGHCVQGLVFLITGDDEKQLDKCEGVSRAYYDKQLLEIEVYPASGNHVARLVFDMAQQLKYQRPDDTYAESSTTAADCLDQSLINHQQPSHQKPDARRARSVDGRRASDYTIETKSTQVDNVNFTKIQHRPRESRREALVYISSRFQEDGDIRDEYIERMNAGIIDARKLGMPEVYVRNVLRRVIPELPLPEPNSLPI